MSPFLLKPDDTTVMSSLLPQILHTTEWRRVEQSTLLCLLILKEEDRRNRRRNEEGGVKKKKKKKKKRYIQKIERKGSIFDVEPWACEKKHTWCDPPQGSLGHDLHGHELAKGGLGVEIGSELKSKCARQGAERNSHIKGQTFKSNVPKDPLQDVGGPMTRARAKAMKQALNCLIQDLQEIEPMLLSQIASHKGPRGIVLLLEAQHEVSKGPHGVQLEEFT